MEVYTSKLITVHISSLSNGEYSEYSKELCGKTMGASLIWNGCTGRDVGQLKCLLELQLRISSAIFQIPLQIS